MPMKITDIEVSSIRFGKLEDDSRTLSHKLAFISYKDDRNRLSAMTPEFITETYGIPREGRTDSGRSSRCLSATSSRSTRTRQTTQR